MSKEDDFYLEEEVEVEEVLDDGFGEVEFEEIKIGFVDAHEAEEVEGDLKDEDLREFLGLGFMFGVFDDPVLQVNVEGLRGLDLEEVLSGGVVREGGKESGKGDFYKERGDAGDFYGGDVYDGPLESESDEVKSETNYEEFVDMDDVNVFVESEPRGGRSMLEISGFVDEEAEKKRKEKRESFW